MSHRSAHINRKVTIGQKKRFAKLKKKRAKSNNHHVNKYGKMEAISIGESSETNDPERNI